MKRANLRRSAGARLRCVAFVCLLVAASSAHASAQTRPGETPAPTQPTQQTGATADEDFELNIDQRRINERDFHAETAVEAGGASGVRLRVGVAVRASDIDVLLQGVRGRVRFRASLAPVLRLLDARRPAPTEAQAPRGTSP